MSKIISIYKIVNLMNNKVYIGKSVHTLKRFTDHKNKLNKRKHKNKHLESAWIKYGQDAFKFVIIEICTENELDLKEKYWIKEYKSTDRLYGYNKMEGGNGGALIGEALKKMTKTHRNNPRIYTQEEKDIISKQNMGRKHSDETKQKISETHKGRPKSEEHRKKLAAALSGKKLSKKHKENMSRARKGVKQKILSCPHCDVTGGVTMYRWHFDKCKKKVL